MGHTVRGAVTAWLALIALQAVASSGSGRVASFFSDVDKLVQRALSPTVAAIPDRRTSGSSTPAFGITAQAAAEAAAAAKAEPGVAAVTGPNGALGPGGLSQYVTGGGLPAGIANNPALR